MENAEQATPTLTYDLNEGERIMINRALGQYAGLFLAQKAAAIVAKKQKRPNLARCDDEIRYATERLEAIDRLADKILKQGRKS